MYLITLKRDGIVIKQSRMEPDAALKLYRSAMLRLCPMEETSADIRALAAFHEMGAKRIAKAIENTKLNTVLIFQAAPQPITTIGE